VARGGWRGHSSTAATTRMGVKTKAAHPRRLALMAYRLLLPTLNEKS
jgi:hypothetical protein